MVRSTIHDAIIDAVLRQLAILDLEGKLGASLTSEIDSLTRWRGLTAPSTTIWNRYKAIRYAVDPQPPPIPKVLTEAEIIEDIGYGNGAAWLEQHDNCLSAIPADHAERPRLKEQRCLLWHHLEEERRRFSKLRQDA
jgi:hypothetical protein